MWWYITVQMIETPGHHMVNLAGTLYQPWKIIGLTRNIFQKKIPETIFDKVQLFPKKFNITEMSSTDASIYSVQCLIHALHNPAPASLLVNLVNDHTAALRTILGIFNKSTPRGKISEGGTT